MKNIDKKEYVLGRYIRMPIKEFAEDVRKAFDTDVDIDCDESDYTLYYEYKDRDGTNNTNCIDKEEVESKMENYYDVKIRYIELVPSGYASNSPYWYIHIHYEDNMFDCGFNLTELKRIRRSLITEVNRREDKHMSNIEAYDELLDKVVNLIANEKTNH